MTQARDPEALRPGAAFEQPFEMLGACHERVARMLGLLERLRAHVAHHGADGQARDAARDVMRYFDIAAPEHHRDEELHVFPALLAAGDPAIMAVVRRMQQEHERMASQWAAARALLAAIMDGRMTSLAPLDEAVLDRFASLYAGHIEAEERVVYPAAQPLLAGAPLQAMSRDMMARRGVAFNAGEPAPPSVAAS